ncbi:MAG: S8 family serine peptidase, partial [Thermoplasmata archaeon]|nr:S8 family serine peptidase [Thermoplasmata archaeon]
MKKAISIFAIGILVLTTVSMLATPVSAEEKVPVIIGFKEKPDQKLVKSLGGEIKYTYSITNAIAAKLPSKAIDAIEANENVEFVEPDYEVHIDLEPNDPRFDELWGLHNTGQTGGTDDADIDAPEAWEIQTGSSDVVIAVIDTGVDYNHEDLSANMWVNPGETSGNGVDDDNNGYIDDVYGWDFCNNDNDPMDDNRHGTHCSGTIAAVGDNGIGVVGVNWAAKIMALKFLSAGGSGSTSDAIAAVQYVTMMKQDFNIPVIATSNSWGGGGYSQALKDAIAAADTAGILFVAAAGNNWNDNDVSPHYPSSYDVPNVIAVAATDHNDALADEQTWGSNYGATSVDLAAPGVSILSTVPDNGYSSFSGTSMATPHVSGVVGLIKAQFPDITSDDIKARILNSVDPIPALDGKIVTGGRLNALNCLNNPPVANAGGPYTGTEDIELIFDGSLSYD